MFIIIDITTLVGVMLHLQSYTRFHIIHVCVMAELEQKLRGHNQI
jgi:hypothetical protein